jgi:shikimate dehydrogenase
MSPLFNVSPWPQGVSMPEGAFVYDLVYNPAETLLIRQARQRGLVTANGLGMLVEQAALAFERWTGFNPDRQFMYQAASQQLG